MAQREVTFYYGCFIALTSLFSLFLLEFGSKKLADAATPITPSGLNTQVNLSATPPAGKVQYDITGGTRPGGGTNLFHSFGDFNVPTNNIANFLNDAGLPTSNILGRVTGGNASIIYGLIQTNGPGGFGNANLFLMNPAGFLFGPNATVNVGGMVAFTTADYLRFQGTNALFNNASTPESLSTLSIAPVAAFGFLGSNPAAIAVQGSTLTVAPGQSISLVGGNRGFDYTDPDTGVTASASIPGGVTMSGGRLSAQGGQINLVSVASSGEVPVSNFLPEASMMRGNISLSQEATIDVSGDAAGTIRIRGGQLELLNSALNADTGNLNGAETAIDIQLTGTLSVSSDSVPALTARSFGDGSAGAISVSSPRMEMVSLLPEVVSLIDTHTEGAGNGGSVSLNAGNAGEISYTGNPGGFDFFIMSGTAGVGNGGNVTVNAGTTNLERARIDTGDALFGGLGSGGHVTFTGGDMNFDLGSTIATDSVNARAGNILLEGRDITIKGGSIGMLSLLGESTLTIKARNFAMLDGANLVNATALGTGGDTTITAQNALFTDGSRIASQTNGDADAGFIKLFVTGDVKFADTFDTQNSALVNPGGLFTNSLGSVGLGSNGNSGFIEVTAQSLTMTGGTRFDSTTQTNGKGGNITIAATEGVSISGERPFQIISDIFGLGDSRATGIYTRTVGSEFCAGPCGSAGSVTISSSSLNLQNGGTINSGTINNGAGGNITTNATSTITISGTMLDGTPGGIYSRTVGQMSDAGKGGTITLTAGQSVTMNNGSTISASSTGPGNTGDITINAGNQFNMTNSTVTTEANQSGGGIIKITTNPNGTVQLTDSTISASVLDGNGGGGSVNIDPQSVVLINSQILAQAVQGPGGNINITTNLLLPDSTSIISASSQFGQQGTVIIQSPISPASGKIVPLGQKPLIATSLLSQRCAAIAGGTISSFTVAGRDSLPAEPGGWVSTPPALSIAGTEDGTVREADRMMSDETPLLSLRKIAPPGFLTQAFAVDSSDCS